jgi:two-component system response regulator RegX3
MSDDAPARVLIVEDEESLVEALRYNLEREGFDASSASDGRQAVERFRAERPDLVLLDLMLPGSSGVDVCRAIRSESTVPVIIISAKDAEADKVAMLELGADDYVTKPFGMRELVSRIRATLRRARMSSEEASVDGILRGGPIELDVSRHEARIRGGLVPFPPKEFDLLEVFLRRPGRLLTRDLLIDQVWGTDYFGNTKTLDVHMKRLRAKIEADPHHPVHLVTVRGLGYKFMS